MPLEIAENYGLQLQDAQAWYSGVHITAHRYVSATALERALEGKCATPRWWELACTDSLDLVLLSTAALVTAGVLPAELAITPTELIHPEVAELMPMVSCIVCVASCVFLVRSICLVCAVQTES